MLCLCPSSRTNVHTVATIWWYFEKSNRIQEGILTPSWNSTELTARLHLLRKFATLYWKPHMIFQSDLLGAIDFRSKGGWDSIWSLGCVPGRDHSPSATSAKSAIIMTNTTCCFLADPSHGANLPRRWVRRSLAGEPRSLPCPLESLRIRQGLWYYGPWGNIGAQMFEAKE